MKNPKVFLCHAHEDKALVRELGKRLREKGIDAWLDEWELQLGDSLRRKIIDEGGIAESDSFIIVVTPNSIESNWVKAELDAAFIRWINEKGYKIIPIFWGIEIEKVPLTLQPMYGIKLNSNLENFDEVVKKLISEIFGLSEKPPLGEPPKIEPSENVGLSHNAFIVARLLCEKSEWGREADPSVEWEDLLSLEIPEDELEEALYELEEEGLITIHKAIGAPRGISHISSKNALFWRVDPVVKGWDPRKDAIKVAGLLANKESLTAIELQKLTEWPIRRLNPAISFLAEHEYVLASKAKHPQFVSPYLHCTSKTRIFLRNKS